MYCLYSVFFSFLTPNTLFPLTLVFFVDLKPAKPISRCISGISVSESTSIFVGVALPLVEEGLVELEGVPFVLGAESEDCLGGGRC